MASSRYVEGSWRVVPDGETDGLIGRCTTSSSAPRSVCFETGHVDHVSRKALRRPALLI
ncbi:hypothetical protein SCP_0116960 [Sparassis crispa]|uniref:Uncharacterized protein n=1 Tax=Sparassis crispa TaxID=139825 RepID=A0A401G9J2_9APHY|nr:hypothetical protein SCP_0116960 [Sparassis crispa]GBE78803.1 hypothetical protein SCP_0116960 [Sparassis crispa]